MSKTYMVERLDFRITVEEVMDKIYSKTIDEEEFRLRFKDQVYIGVKEEIGDRKGHLIAVRAVHFMTFQPMYGFQLHMDPDYNAFDKDTVCRLDTSILNDLIKREFKEKSYAE